MIVTLCPGDWGWPGFQVLKVARRSAGIEHVLRTKNPVQLVAMLSQSSEVTPAAPASSASAGNEETDRAWRKFCRHQLDMTERDRQLVRDTPVPDWLIGQCYSANLLK